jgi:fatty acid desaturase
VNNAVFTADRIDAISSSPAAIAGMGAVRRTRPRGESINVTNSYTALAKVVRERGLLRRSRLFYGGVAAALVGLIAVAGVGFALLGDSWYQLLVAAGLGIIFTQFAFVAHEASHRQVLHSGPANDKLGRFLASFVVGMSYSWWMTKHTRHHANPNRVDKDPDIAVDTVAFTPESAATQRGFLAAVTHRQGYLFFPLLLLEGVNLHLQSVKNLISPEPVKGRWIEWTFIVVRFAAYFGVIFYFLPLGMAFAFIGVQLAVFGLYMGSAFAPNHIGMAIIGADTKLDFLSKQVLTSRNIAGGWWATLLMGGLNYQVEHHLFPNMPRPFLAKTRDIVRVHCQSVGVPYTETSLRAGYAAVIKHMHTVGLAARDPFSCPAAAQFGRG